MVLSFLLYRCEFVDDNQTFRCQLADTAISTEDLIMPLPIEIVSTGDREKDFDTLWDWMEEDTKKDRYGFYIARGVVGFHHDILSS